MGYTYTAGQLVTLLAAMPPQDRTRVDSRVGRGLGPRYVEHGQPCCLVAHLLVQAGMDVKTVHQLDQENRDRRGQRGHGSLELPHSRHKLWARFEPAARQLLEFVQFLQDGGRTWGDVADAALRPAPALGLLAVRHTGRPWLTMSA